MQFFGLIVLIFMALMFGFYRFILPKLEKIGEKVETPIVKALKENREESQGENNVQ